MIKCDFCEYSKPHSLFNNERFRCNFTNDKDFAELKHRKCSKAVQKMQEKLNKEEN